MKRVADGGFTIVETLIVLAVTGVIFLSMVGVVAGQQGKAQFKNAVNNVAADIQTAISNVTNGYYPLSPSQFACGVSDGAPDLSGTASSAERGTNKDCTFLGQAFWFSSSVGANGDQQYKIHTLVGLRRTAEGKEPFNLNEARVRVAAPGNGYPVTWTRPDMELPSKYASYGRLTGGEYIDPETRNTVTGGWPDLSVTKTLPFGTTVEWLRTEGNSDTAGRNAIAGFAIVTAPNGQVGSGGSVQSGVVIPSIIPITCASYTDCTSERATPANGVDAIVRNLDTNGATARPRGVQFCFRSSSSDQSGLIAIGASGSSDSVEVTIHNNPDCSTGGSGEPIYVK